MSIICDNRNGTSIRCAAEAIYEGYVYKDDGNGMMTVITAKGDAAFAVALESTVDAQDGTAKTLTSGDSANFALLGCGLTVSVASVASQTYQYGALVYLSDDHDGMIVSSAATSTPIGYYVGKDNTATGSSDAELVPIYLGIQPDEATV